MQNFYTCKPGQEVKADENIVNAAKTLVPGMFYKVRIQAMISYYLEYRVELLSKKDTRIKFSLAQEYIKVPEYWCVAELQCWMKHACQARDGPDLTRD